MVADHRAAAQRGEADRCRRCRAPVWPSRTRTLFSRKPDAAAARGGLAEQQRGAGGRIDLVAVVHLEDLDVEILGLERLRRLLDQDGEQVDAEAHIAGFDDGRMAGGGGDLARRPLASQPVVPMTWTMRACAA